MSAIGEWKQRLDTFVWGRRAAVLPREQRWLVRVLRFGYVLVRDLAAGQLNLRAMSLVYTTLLSLVPLLAFSFSVLKGLGVHNQLEPILFSSLQALGPKGEELGRRIMGFVENVRADVLGSIGLALLIYLVISLVQKVEASFNYVWHVQKARSFATRFSNYLSVILIGPLLVTAALGITATVSSNEIVRELAEIEPFGTLLLVFSLMLPYLIVIGAFTFVYIFVPNADVRLVPALIGGVVAGLAWQTTGWVFTTFVAGSAKYVAIYSSFAIVLTFMIWLYLNWLILLLGAQVAFYVQNPNFVEKSGGRLSLSSHLREILALETMYLVGKAFRQRSPVWNVKRLAEHLHIPGDSLAMVTARLERAGLLLMTDEAEGRFIPGQDMERITVEDIRAAVRRTDPELDHDERLVPVSEEVASLAGEMDAMVREKLAGRTLRDMVGSE
ncbi:MAG TPA: YhjD/YihY/BrkB family envelope integrity protein [Gammaproteobacteria bacterium]